MRPLYSAMIFVALNSSLATYFVWRPDGAIKMVEAQLPDAPRLRLCRVSIFEVGVAVFDAPKVSSLP
jgi:hypothetical protein